MSKVIIVNQSTGNFRYIDSEGNVTEDLGNSEVTMNRLTEGYIHLAAHEIAFQLDLVGNFPDDVWSLTDMVYSANGKLVRPKLISAEKMWSIQDQLTRSPIKRSVAVLDMELDTLKWLVNPLKVDQFSTYWSDAPLVRCGTPTENVLFSAEAQLQGSLEPTESMLRVYFEAA